MSDWSAFSISISYCLFHIFFCRLGTYGVDLGLNAGVDLEMPGVGKWRTLNYVHRSLQARKVTVATIKQRAKKVLGLLQKCAQGAPEVGV